MGAGLPDEKRQACGGDLQIRAVVRKGVYWSVSMKVLNDVLGDMSVHTCVCALV